MKIVKTVADSAGCERINDELREICRGIAEMKKPEGESGRKKSKTEK
ncbi:hypothetical protein [Rahnella sikkimica]|nr:hypothetical protein [Rahnella sikkimica]